MPLLSGCTTRDVTHRSSREALPAQGPLGTTSGSTRPQAGSAQRCQVGLSPLVRQTPSALTKENSMWNRLNLRLIGSASTLALLVTVVEAGRKWH